MRRAAASSASRPSRRPRAPSWPSAAPRSSNGGADVDARRRSPAAAAERAYASLRASLRPVINATGVIIHTNLGRAPLSDEAIAAMDAVGRGY